MASNDPGTFNQGPVPSDHQGQPVGSPSDPNSPAQQNQPGVTPANASQGGREINKRVLYVGGVDQNVTEDMLSELFKVTGNVSSIKIFPDKNVSFANLHILLYGIYIRTNSFLETWFQLRLR